MSDLLEKFIKIIISEIVEGAFFIGCILIINSILPSDGIRENMINLILFMWAIAGIGTPIVIFFELEKEVFTFLKVIKN